MEHRLLEYFVAVGEELHFTKAADKLNISQPTLSQQIRILEQEMGTPLFHRSGKKNYLTQAGHILMEHARRVFHELDQAKLEINELAGMKRGKLSLGCSGNHLLLNTLISFHRQFPGIELTITELATEETCEGLLHNKLDLGVVFLPIKHEQLVSTPLYNEELILAVSSHHPFSQLASIRLEQLSELPLILFPHKFLVRQILDSACTEIGTTLHPILELSTMESQWQLAAQNIGGTVLPATYAATIRDERIVIVPLAKPTPQKSVGIVHRRDMYMDSVTLAFIDHLTRNNIFGASSVTG